MRPFVVYKEGFSDDEGPGGGDPVPSWLDDRYCVRSEFCQCNLVGIAASGSPRTVNGQSCHYLGRLYANRESVWDGGCQGFRCSCPCSEVLTHYPSAECDGHTMDVHIAVKLTRSVISMFAHPSRGGHWLVPRKYSRKEASEKALKSEDERLRRSKVERRIEDANLDVERFLRKCEARRAT